MIAEVVGFTGKIIFDTTKPDGTIRKLMDVNRLASMGWKAKIGLEQGILETYHWFKVNDTNLREA
jgi:nucleoside-diphosphate-sugar epimerase